MTEYSRPDGARQPIGVPDLAELTVRRTALLRQRRIGRGVLLEALLLATYLALVIGAVAIAEWIG